jgi:bile acid:Na+ symporter, BASS family
MSPNIFSDIFLPITLAIITLGLGLSISYQDIKNIVIQPWNVLIGLMSQLLILPVIAFAIALITGMDAEYAVGLVIIAACPGGATSNLVNYMIKGNVTLSLSITIVNSLITIFTIPLITKLALDVFLAQDAMIHLSFMNTVLNISLITVIPATIGVLIRRWSKNFAAKMENPLRYILPVLLFFVYAGVIFYDKGEDVLALSKYINLLPYAVALNVMSTFAGFYIPGLFNLSKRDRFTIAIEVGLQNSTLGIFVASTLLNNYKMALVAVVYGSFSFFTTWLFGYIAKKYL